MPVFHCAPLSLFGRNENFAHSNFSSKKKNDRKQKMSTENEKALYCLNMILEKNALNKEQERLYRKKQKEWQECEIPIPHKFADAILNMQGECIFKDNVFWPHQVANLGYCAHFSNGFFDCNQMAIPSKGKLLLKYCSEHECQNRAYKLQQEKELQEFLQLQQQELLNLLKRYKNSV